MRRAWLLALVGLASGWDYAAAVRDDPPLPVAERVALHERRLADAERAGDQLRMAAELALVCNGHQYLRFQRNPPACARALELARALSEPEIAGYVLGAQALFSVWLMDFDAAFAGAAEGRRALAGRPGWIIDLAEGSAHHERGDYHRALAALERAVTAARASGASDAIGLTEASLARLHYVMGDLPRAEERAGEALAVGLATFDGNTEWLARWVLGLVEDDRGRHEHALVQWRLGFIAAQRLGSPWGASPLATNVAYALLSLNRPEEAAPWVREKRRQLEAGLAPRSWEPELEQLEGSLAYGLRDYAAAAAHFERARQSPRRRLVVRALLARARSLRHLGQLAEARRAYRELIAKVDENRELTPEDQRGNFLAANLAGYQELVSLLWETEGAGGAEEAFAVAEAGRARSLLDALHAAGRTATRRPALASAEVRQRLAAGEALVSYVSTEDRLLAVVVTRERVGFTVLPGAGARSHLAERVRYYRRLLAESDGAAELAPAGRRLYQDLVAPLLPAGTTTLLVAVDGPLAYLPFDALIGADGRFLVESLAVAHVPSATLAFAGDADAVGDRPVLAVADPATTGDWAPLPHARAEAEAVLAAAQGRGRLLVGGAASEPAVKEGAQAPASVWHFATHARADEAIPLRSALVLAPGGADDGLLTAREIFGLSLRTPVVVLSGCDTGHGALVGSEGAQSLSRAFQFAGARSVVSTLWAIGDRSSEPLMVAFYRRLAAGRPVPQALAEAKRELLRRGVPPRTWAAFLASGAPDARAALAAPTPVWRRAGIPVALTLFAALSLFWLVRRRG